VKISRIRAVHIMQSEDKPLATKSSWAMTYDDCKDAKAPAVKFIVPIAILHHFKSAIVPAMKLVSLQLPLQQMCWSKTFVLSLQEAMPTWLHHTTNNVDHCRSNNNNIVSAQAEHGDCADDHHHSLKLHPSIRTLSTAISKANNFVPHNDQTFSLLLNTTSVNLRPQINQIEV
jgi:hypothetical protein